MVETAALRYNVLMEKGTGFITLCSLAMIMLLGCTTQQADYTAIDDLPNPGRGWSTHSSVSTDSVNNDYPPSTVAYYRFTWAQAEPMEGAYAFDRIDGLIASARAAGQRFAFRIMPDACRGGIGIPAWLYAKGVKGWLYTGEDGSQCFSADASDPVYMEHAHALTAAMGARYNGSADLEFVDIGLMGDYGEWHFTQAAAKGAAMPPYAVRTQYIDWHLQAFPDTPLIMLVGDLTAADSDTLSYAVSHGTGWRADCWGDYRSPFNHMEDDYPLKLAAPGVRDAWRRAPVVLETCGVLQDWRGAWPDRLQDALDFAIAEHASILNAKSSPVPVDWAVPLAVFTQSIGYRFAFAGTPVIPAAVDRGAGAAVSITWTNAGNAPVYRRWVPAVRFTANGRELARAVSSVDIRTWMPKSADGLDYTLDFTVTVPVGETACTAVVEAALLDPATGKPVIRLAEEGASPELWYPVGAIEIR